jgi:hypothetical protein
VQFFKSIVPSNFWQLINASLPIDVIVFGKCIYSKFEQLLNTFRAITDNLEFNDAYIRFNELHLLNAALDIVVTLSGISNSSNAVL